MTRGTTLQKHNRGRAQHLQNIRFHVNNVFDAHCADPIGPATSKFERNSCEFHILVNL